MKNPDQEFTYIITETGPWTSLDPLQGDSTQNLPVQRMIYATPLEISQNNQLVSSVLDSFSYDVSSKTMTWMAKSHLEFDDGEPLTAENVAFSVLRMAYARPQFPVIESIGGLQEWLAQEFPLQSWPSGINVKGQKIEITFDRDVKAPLFRFSLELFSVIPKHCVDLKTSRLMCERPPARYILTDCNIYLIICRVEQTLNSQKVIMKYRLFIVPVIFIFNFFSLPVFSAEAINGLVPPQEGDCETEPLQGIDKILSDVVNVKDTVCIC